MALEKVSAEEWIDQVKRRTVALPVHLGDYIGRFQLTPAGLPLEDIDARYHVGDLRVDGNFRPESLITAVDGDLVVGGLISTQGGEGADGNATLIVFGDVRCKTLINEWGSIIIVTGDLIIDEWAYAGREDSSLVVGGNFRTPIYIGADIGVTVGGAVEADYAYGYATNFPELGQTYGASKTLENRSWREIAARLGLGREVMAEEGLMEALDMRVITTGSLLPS
ncbi:hypothetical protein [Agrobacterium pusense]|uniref:hypothetical protein n=1 Tax=Agrobacterium pusense TaxID=648995 RepID=UPI00156BD794|nr:hypothetical protein [Agrobacterium pusense]QKJ92494.1 hypothetical protein HQN82_13670 [Agrobacterium pusense]